jgi:hypothetical protein
MPGYQPTMAHMVAPDFMTLLKLSIQEILHPHKNVTLLLHGIHYLSYFFPLPLLISHFYDEAAKVDARKSSVGISFR